MGGIGVWAWGIRRNHSWSLRRLLVSVAGGGAGSDRSLCWLGVVGVGVIDASGRGGGD